MIGGLIVDFLTLVLIGAIAAFVEKNHVERWSIIANGVIIWGTMGLGIFQAHTAFVLWAIGLAMASVISFVSYVKGESLWSFAYDFFYAFYSSKTVLAVILAATMGITSPLFLPLAAIFSLAFWYVAISRLNHSIPFFG